MEPPSHTPVWIRVARATAKSPVYGLVAIIILFEDLFLEEIRAFALWFARLGVVAAVERWLARRNRWTILLLFLVPVGLLIPIKIAAIALMAHHHWVLGLAVLVLAKIVGASYSVRLFAIGKDKLMSFPAFAWAWGWIQTFRAALHTALKTSFAYRLARRMIHGATGRIGRLLAPLRRAFAR